MVDSYLDNGDMAKCLQCSLRPQGQSQSLARRRSSRAIWILEYADLDKLLTGLINAAETQVQPFHLVTPDNETLYGWHLLPLHLCRQYEEELMNNPPNGPASDYTDTVAHKVLANDPNARVVVSCKCDFCQNSMCHNCSSRCFKKQKGLAGSGQAP